MRNRRTYLSDGLASDGGSAPCVIEDQWLGPLWTRSGAMYPGSCGVSGCFSCRRAQSYGPWAFHGNVCRTRTSKMGYTRTNATIPATTTLLSLACPFHKPYHHAGAPRSSRYVKIGKAPKLWATCVGDHATSLG